jgi:hypothetical protein
VQKVDLVKHKQSRAILDSFATKRHHSKAQITIVVLLGLFVTLRQPLTPICMHQQAN